MGSKDLKNLKKQIGQLFVVGYQGVDPTDDFLDFINEWSIGGVIVFARNLANPLHLPVVLQRLAEAAGQLQFTAIDQEGGLVMRILSKGSLFPGAMGLAATGRPDQAEKIATAIAIEMRALGLNWNLAPVLDINHPKNPGIGARSFGETPEIVVRFGIPFIRGLQQGGVLACAKHFPGKGHARVDSHLSLPTIPYDRERLRSFELVPFKAAIEAGVAAIMTSHVFFPAFEATSNLPATLSRSVLTDLLRHEMGFDGLLITDDLEMGAITEAFGVPQAARQAFLAGADLLLICHDLQRQKQAAEMLLEEIQANPEARRRLDESLARIDRARAILAAAKPTCSISELAARHRPLVEEAHKLSILIAHQNEGVLPLRVDQPILALLPRISSLVQVEEIHQNEGFSALVKSRFPKALIAIFEPKGSADEIIAEYRRLVQKASDELQAPSLPLVIFTYNAHLFEGQATAVRQILDLHCVSASLSSLPSSSTSCSFSSSTSSFDLASNSISASSFSSSISPSVVVAVRNPYDLELFPQAGACLATFGFRTPAISAGLDVLAGYATAGRGPWPVELTAFSKT